MNLQQLEEEASKYEQATCELLLTFAAAAAIGAEKPLSVIVI
jgi:hypothetical protein